MGNPIVHFEIRTTDPEAGQAFYGDLFGWSFIGAPPEHVDGYAYINSESDRTSIHGGISSTQGHQPLITVYAEVDDLKASLSRAVELGAEVVQAPYDVPGVTIALIADPQGNVIGMAQPNNGPEQPGAPGLGL